MKHRLLLNLALCLLASPLVFAGEAWIVPLENMVAGSAVVRVIEVKEVTDVKVPAGEGGGTVVHVARATTLQALKGGVASGDGENGDFALVCSTLPSTDAVWVAPKKGKYLAFLNGRQGHFDYQCLWWLRAIDDQGKVAWIEQDAAGVYQTSRINLSAAIAKITPIVKAQQTQMENAVKQTSRKGKK